jgi:hypothetical protein
MQERLRPARIVTMLSLTATALVAANRAGWPMIAAAIATLVVVSVGGAGLERKRRPELWVFASTIVWLQLMLAVAVVFSGGPRGGGASMLAIPVLMVAARFNNRGLVVGAPISALLVVDARHPGLASDVDAWRWLQRAVPTPAIVATKIDKLSRAERLRALRTNEAVFEHPVLPVSAVTGEGLDQLWKLIEQLTKPE